MIWTSDSQSGLYRPPRVYDNLQGVYDSVKKIWGCMKQKWGIVDPNVDSSKDLFESYPCKISRFQRSKTQKTLEPPLNPLGAKFLKITSYCTCRACKVKIRFRSIELFQQGFVEIDNRPPFPTPWGRVENY